jgi:hypothetical protein
VPFGQRQAVDAPAVPLGQVQMGVE